MPPTAEWPSPPATASPTGPGGPAATDPPEQLRAGELLLRRARTSDAEAVAAAVRASLDHLRPWLPWATTAAGDYRTQFARLSEADQMWRAGTDYVYVVLSPDGTLIGNIGLHRRVGDGGVEIGYWISASQTRRGYGTAAAGALTEAAAALPGVTRTEIHCDETNAASAGIPRKLGYRLDRIDSHTPEAPGETGRRMVWVWDAASQQTG